MKTGTSKELSHSSYKIKLGYTTTYGLKGWHIINIWNAPLRPVCSHNLCNNVHLKHKNAKKWENSLIFPSIWKQHHLSKTSFPYNALLHKFSINSVSVSVLKYILMPNIWTNSVGMFLCFTIRFELKFNTTNTIFGIRFHFIFPR